MTNFLLNFLVLVYLSCTVSVTALRYQGSMTDPLLECARCHGKNTPGNTNIGLKGRLEMRKKRLAGQSRASTSMKIGQLRGQQDIASEISKTDEIKGNQESVR